MFCLDHLHQGYNIIYKEYEISRLNLQREFYFEM